MMMLGLLLLPALLWTRGAWGGEDKPSNEDTLPLSLTGASEFDEENAITKLRWKAMAVGKKARHHPTAPRALLGCAHPPRRNLWRQRGLRCRGDGNKLS
ncbi:hypothetical protein PC129_g15958 [Phytophthora cactorum]|uniref:Uncharacterized protein n=1 Tax=Phytophthora cactorum TaxID=29920 RepID=A0A8T1HLU9_9STRA|nr:hypothetical protein Pcac1_g19580 [Phytophthora cactorum]KAG2876253.1 hypothetical protein PC114_g24290 [Phytophthora cactorum]KAG2974625.1 hypothetical protein PC119_g22651 [Phytophthora cactorum]KAG2986850.1 hypothetical protein PC120_g23746 [Phytophthora cactorum]KAG3165859.1 hypothetical protein C6341_g12227 [Phytophthora cactorum]